MRPALNWQPLLLAASLILAIGLAIGGWTLGRWRSQSHAQVKKSNSGEALAQSPIVQQPIPMPDPNGVIALEPSSADLHGTVTSSLIEGEDALVGWSSTQDIATWYFRATRPGFYTAELTYATSEAAVDAELQLRVDDRMRLCSLRASGGLERFITDEYAVAVPTSGVHQLMIQPHSELSGPWLVLRSVRLIPTKADK